MVFKFGDPDLYTQLAEEIDAIKGPLYCHGLLTYMRNLGIVKTSRGSDGIRLGLGVGLFKVVPYNLTIAKKITAFLQMSTVLTTLPLAKNLSTYVDNTVSVSEAMRRYKVPQLFKSAYNKAWTIRAYQVAICRLNGIQRLSYGPTDIVRMLPGPDGMNARRILGPKRTVADLYNNLGDMPRRMPPWRKV